MLAAVMPRRAASAPGRIGPDSSRATSALSRVGVIPLCIAGARRWNARRLITVRSPPASSASVLSTVAVCGIDIALPPVGRSGADEHVVLAALRRVALHRAHVAVHVLPTAQCRGQRGHHAGGD